MRFTPAMADWMVWISVPRLSMGAKMREMQPITVTEVPTDIPNSVRISAFPEAESSMTAPTTAALSSSTTGE